MSRHVVSLDSKAALQEQQAGGKGASLAWLRRAGFQVPPGFVISTAAFEDMLGAAGIELSSHGKTWTPDELQQIRQQIGACPIPDGLASQIDRAYQGLESVAVRSSMVGEDTVLASFAGQLDTVLNVKGLEGVLAALKQCWASLFNWRLFQYLNQRQADLQQTLLETLSMAVVVQRMVDAEAAGVAFSADPVTGQGNVIIEAARGLGDAVVQGLVQPDRYVVDARNVVAEKAVVEKGSPVLEDDGILRLVDMVRDVAERRECPQDIEWAWDGAKFHLLQCRPITSLVGKTVYSSRMVSEMVPGLIKPLVWHTNTTSIVQNVFGRIFTELLGDADIDYDSMIRRIHSRLYANVTLFGELFDRLGMPGNFFEMVTRDETAQRRRPKLSLRNLGAVARLLRFAWRHSRVVDDTKAFVRRHHQELEPYRRTLTPALEPQELLARYDELARLHGETQWFVFIGPINMTVRNRILNRLVERRAPDVVPSDLIRGLVGLKALEPNQELQKLAAQAAALDSETQRLLTEGDDQTIRQVLSASDQGQALLGAVDAFLERYGFLSTSGTDFAGTSWVEDPTVIWHCIGRSAASPMDRRAEDVGTIRETARHRVRSALNPFERLIFDRLLNSTVALIDLREQVSLLMSEDAFHMRRIFLALADHLVRRGDLAERDDIFYLTYAELLQLVDGELEADVAKESVEARKAKMEQDAQIEPPDTVCGDHVPAQPVSLPEDQEYLVGICGSSGLARGRARIVLNPSQAPVSLSQDDILVVPFTDVGWTPLLSGIGGIVAETGGQLSHTAIVAREYGLPAVVSVKQATRLIQDGQRVTVDGDSGRVYLGR
jgi:phosphohistidine swiveling domain-containing protein